MRKELGEVTGDEKMGSGGQCEKDEPSKTSSVKSCDKLIDKKSASSEQKSHKAKAPEQVYLGKKIDFQAKKDGMASKENCPKKLKNCVIAAAKYCSAKDFPVKECPSKDFLAKQCPKESKTDLSDVKASASMDDGVNKNKISPAGKQDNLNEIKICASNLKDSKDQEEDIVDVKESCRKELPETTNSLTSTNQKKLSQKMNTSAPRLRICATCHQCEPIAGLYKKCARCKAEGRVDAKYYCGKKCQEIDWHARHKQEHIKQSVAV